LYGVGCIGWDPVEISGACFGRRAVDRELALSTGDVDNKIIQQFSRWYIPCEALMMSAMPNIRLEKRD
jgi:hypothetical protein